MIVAHPPLLVVEELGVVGKGDPSDVHAMRTTRWRRVSSARPRKSLPIIGLHEIYLQEILSKRRLAP